MKFQLSTFFLFSAVLLNAQSDLDLPKTREVIVTNGDSMIRAHVLYAQQKEVHTKDKSEYYWYYSNNIKKNRGSYYGKLLYGEYIVFDGGNNMVKRGDMNKGRMDGEWKEWYADGTLKSEIKWKKGVCHGRYFLYNKEGNLIEKGRFKKGRKLEKRVEIINQSKPEKIKYVSLKKLKKKEKPSKTTDRVEKKPFRLFKKGQRVKTEGKKKEIRNAEKIENQEGSWLKNLFKSKTTKVN